jgi:alpha-tubulin suppressor-like RCC1 family protein
VTLAAGFGPGTSPGQLYAFGLNSYEQLGNTQNLGTEIPNSPAPAELPGGPVTQVATGADFGLALTEGGQLYAFGDNYYGQLGNEKHLEANTANPPTLVELPDGAGKVVQVAAGNNFSLAVTAGGQLYGFGLNYKGQLGNQGTIGVYATPTPIELPGATGKVVQVAAGFEFSLALTATGQLYAFGDNQYGQLGNKQNIETPVENPTPTLVELPAGAGKIVQVAAGSNFSLVVTEDGQLYSFGVDEDGQLGNEQNLETEKANPTPTEVELPAGAGRVVQVAAGKNFSLAVTAGGQLYGFGTNAKGQLGDQPDQGNHRNTGVYATPTPIELPGTTGRLIEVAAGLEFSLALTASGQLYGFGGNEYGQLGNGQNIGTSAENATPTLVELPGGATVDTISRGSQAQGALVVVADLAVASASLPPGVQGTPYSATVQVSGGEPPYNWSATGLPGGLTIDPASGTIAGTPSSSGGSIVALTVTDADGIGVSATLALAIGSPGGGGGGSPGGSAGAPVSSAPPVLSGLPIAGRTVGVSPGIWGDDPTSFAYQWQRCDPTDSSCVNIAGAEGATYLIAQNLVGRRIRAVVTATNAAGATSALSGLSAAVGAVIESSITYTFRYTRRYTAVGALTLHSLPPGGDVEVRCRGGGCPFTQAHAAAKSHACHSGKRCKRTRSAPAGTSEVNLAGIFKGRHLHLGTRITIDITKLDWIGKSILFTTRADAVPRVQIACLAPGSTQPGQGC